MRKSLLATFRSNGHAQIQQECRHGNQDGCLRYSGPIAHSTEAPDDVAGIARALGDIARAKGMAQVAKEAGLSRESLYKALSENGNPSFATILKVTKALGVRLHAGMA